MNRWMQSFVALTSSKKGATITLIVWLLIAILLSGIAPTAKDYSVNVNGADLPEDALSEVAKKELKRYFPEDGGNPALLVFHNPKKLDQEDLKQVRQMSEYLESQQAPKTIKETVPFHQLPEPAQLGFLSKDQTTLVLPVILKDHLEMEEINETIQKFQKKGDSLVQGPTQFKITGPAGIASDTIAIFANADLVLLFSTIGLIFVLLIFIYRSPLLAIIPLLVSGIAYQVTDRLLGLSAKNGWFELESQSLSIASILLFAVLTDYSLLVFARFREELKKEENKYVAMQTAMKQVWEPIFFSGGTVLAAMIVLFIADYLPYQNFAPVFSLTMFVLLIAGLTLIPALFVLFGRKSFWPVIPKVGETSKSTRSYWTKIGSWVVKKPGVISSVVIVLLLICSIYMTQITYSFNLIKSFPEEMNSRVGYEWLEKHYSKGDLAPTTVLLVSSQKIDTKKLEKLKNQLASQTGVEKVTTEFNSNSLPTKGEDNKILSNSGKVARLQFVFKDNPYEQISIDQLRSMRNQANDLLQKSGFSPKTDQLHFAGETAKQVDIQELNDRDTRNVIIWVTLLIVLLLGIQTRSLIAPIYMIFTIVLSYAAAMGLSTFVFQQFWDLPTMSYRIPLYTFVFLVALGVDYSIMLVSRIRYENKNYGLKEAVQRGVSLTGGVISSAGVILAATFGVLMTQPILELFMFGFAVALGILLDTFLVRALLVPSFITLLGKYSFWPTKVKTQKSS